VARLDETNPDLMAVLYVDGHVRAYQGGRKVAKTHLSRLRFPAPATVETWVSDAACDPALVVMAEPGASLAMELRRLLPELRRAVGDDRRWQVNDSNLRSFMDLQTNGGKPVTSENAYPPTTSVRIPHR
jgi:prepilin-type processing-associated H-X9-DG protein